MTFYRLAGKPALMCSSILALSFSLFNPAEAQDRQTSAVPQTELDEVIVTGTTSRRVTALESSVALTIISGEDLRRDPPRSLVDTLKAIPSVYVQDSGGPSSNNISVRGMPAGDHFRYVSVQEDGLPVNYDQYTIDAVQRYSLGINRVEAVRGGTSGVLAPNASGSIVNYLYRKGTQESQGIVGLTYASFDNIRSDFFYGGPLSDDWTVALSGYYQFGDSERENGFNGERGGEFRANLTRRLDRGELNLTYKKVSENNSFVLPLPVQRNAANGSIVEIPGFDLLNGNVGSFNNTRIRTLFADGSRVEQNIIDGFDVDADVFTARLDYDFTDNLFFSHSSRVSSLTRLGQAHFTGSAGNNSLRPGQSYLTDNTINFNGGYGTTGNFWALYPGADRCFRFAANGRLLCSGNPALATLNGNGFVQVLNSLREPIKREQFISDTRLTYETERNTLTGGVIFVNLSHDRALASSLFLSEVRSSGADILDIVAVAPGTSNILGFLSEGGVVRHGQFRGDDDVQVDSVSVYLNDEFRVSDKLRLDFGFRWESADYQGSSLNGLGTMVPVVGALTTTGTDTDNILANNFANRLRGDGTATRFETTYEDVAWTAGFNYTVTDSLAVYGRYAEGFQTPRADRLGDFFQGGRGVPLETNELSEFGARYSGDNLAASATAFRTFFPNYLAGGFGVDASNTQIFNQAELEVLGVEFDVTWEPTDQVSINAVGVISDNKLDNFTTVGGAAFNGNELARNPSEQFRLSGVYSPTDKIDLFGNVRYIGERFGANDNVVKFDACTIVGAGASYALSDRATFQVTGTNLTEELCFTEGNPRATVAQNQLDVGFARPMAGRRLFASVQLKF